MRLQIWTPCLLLLALAAGAAALHTAVPADEPTPEAQELPLKRTIPRVRLHTCMRLQTHTRMHLSDVHCMIHLHR